jgi:DNA polymerase-1
MLDILKNNNQLDLYFDIELPLVDVLKDMEVHGIKVDKAALLEYQSMLSEKINSLTDEIYELAGGAFNINSPQQLGPILFDKLALPSSKKTKTGYSTNHDVLEKLRPYHPIINLILEYRTMTKLKSTYADGLLNTISEDGKIYSTFNQVITTTGRISSTEPNLQNIPIKMDIGRELRKAFIPSSSEYVFLDGDYSQIELRVLAHIAGDQTMIGAFLNHEDIHRLTASQVFNTPIELVTPKQRSNAKAVNFGIVYGISAFSLSQDLNITKKEAEKYINGYFEKYPMVKKYLDSAVSSATENGYAETLFNRRRDMPELKSSNFNLRSFGERAAMNMPIQGTAADIIKIAMNRVHSRIKEEHLDAKLILQVHDELLIEVNKKHAKKAMKIFKYEMENAFKLKSKLEADFSSGPNWFEAK